MEYVRQRGPVAAGTIGQGLNLSVPTVRHHLGILASDGRITADSMKRSAHLRGRPQKLYRLSDSSGGDNLGMLSGAIFSLWSGSKLKQGDSSERLRLLADDMRERMGSADERLPATKRLEQWIEKLNDAHYEARWEAGAQGPRILFGRCPYAEIIDQHPELCTVDGFLLGGAMNAEAEQLSKIDRKQGSPDRCIFALKRAVRRGG